VFENRVVVRIFGTNRDEVTGGWRGLRNEELHNIVPSSKYNENNQVKENETVGTYSTNEKGNACKLLVGKLEGKRPIGRQIHMWIDNIKMDFGDLE
jgi:hypothetical protein